MSIGGHWDNHLPRFPSIHTESSAPEGGSYHWVVCCQHCGGSHEGECHRIKSIEYYPDGSIKRVEYREDT
jgi:hypothetical protein